MGHRNHYQRSILLVRFLRSVSNCALRRGAKVFGQEDYSNFNATMCHNAVLVSHEPTLKLCLKQSRHHKGSFGLEYYLTDSVVVAKQTRNVLIIALQRCWLAIAVRIVSPALNDLVCWSEVY